LNAVYADLSLGADTQVRPYDVGDDVSTKPQILFVCVHNAGRSQMAAALAEMIGAGRIVVRSAGSAPASEVHPNVVLAMAELGIDLSSSPRVLADDDVHASDAVITMGCGDACPVFPGKCYVDWEIDDPAGLPLADVRRIRGVIRLKVEALLRELQVI
jgi:arsenate reductase